MPSERKAGGEIKARWCATCAKRYPGAVTNKAICEDCGHAQARFGTEVERKIRWCNSCKKNHGPDLVNLTSKKCNDCRKRSPSYGMPTDGKVLWCASCATKGHEGAIPMGMRKCEDCNQKRPNFGLPGEERTRWCSGCAKNHGGVDLITKKCEGCNDKTPNYGLEPERKARWCRWCAQGKEGAVSLSRKCEDCKMKNPSCGMLADKTARWCTTCAKLHPGSLSLVLLRLKKQQLQKEIQQREAALAEELQEKVGKRVRAVWKLDPNAEPKEKKPRGGSRGTGSRPGWAATMAVRKAAQETGGAPIPKTTRTKRLETHRKSFEAEMYAILGDRIDSRGKKHAAQIKKAAKAAATKALEHFQELLDEFAPLPVKAATAKIATATVSATTAAAAGDIPTAKVKSPVTAKAKAAVAAPAEIESAEEPIVAARATRARRK